MRNEASGSGGLRAFARTFIREPLSHTQVGGARDVTRIAASRRLAPLVACVLAVGLTVPASALACGFHTQKSISQAMLNWRYPEALHVTGAIWRGQQAGVLEMPDRARLQATGAEREFRDNAAYMAAQRALYALGRALEESATGVPAPGVSVVLVETMLWTQIAADGGVEVHVDGPGEGQLVAVTDAPALHAIESGRLTLAEAARAGYLRLYGDPGRAETFLATHGAVGTAALPAPDPRTVFAKGLGRPSASTNQLCALRSVCALTQRESTQ